MTCYTTARGKTAYRGGAFAWVCETADRGRFQFPVPTARPTPHPVRNAQVNGLIHHENDRTSLCSFDDAAPVLTSPSAERALVGKWRAARPQLHVFLRCATTRRAGTLAACQNLAYYDSAVRGSFFYRSDYEQTHVLQFADPKPNFSIKTSLKTARRLLPTQASGVARGIDL